MTGTKAMVIAAALTVANASPAASEVFMRALSKLESNNNPKAIGDKHLKNHAYGLYQMRQPAVDDVNRCFKTTYKAEDMLNPVIARDAAQKYLTLLSNYWIKRNKNKPLTPNILARLWNGGYTGDNRETTLSYEKKFMICYNESVAQLKNVCVVEKNNQGM